MIISVIIPTLNRSKQLALTLISLTKQDFDINFEVIVVDNGSTDDTKTTVEKFTTQIPNLVYIYDSMPGLLTGRHHGAAISKGEILCFLDDDVTLNKDYVKNLAAVFLKDETLHFATGPCLPNYEIDPPGWLSHFWQKNPVGKYCGWLSLLDFGNMEIDISPNFVWGLNFCIRKVTLFELGGFHPDCIPNRLQKYQGDGETGLTLKGIEKGLKAKYIPGLKLDHYVSRHRLTIEYFKQRAFYQGVCNSYTDLRRQQSPVNLTNKSISFRDRIRPYYRWIKHLMIGKSSKKKLPEEIYIFFDHLASAEKSGYQFHQNSFTQEAQVKDWVLRKDYWDYKLPSI